MNVFFLVTIDIFSLINREMVPVYINMMLPTYKISTMKKKMIQAELKLNISYINFFSGGSSIGALGCHPHLSRIKKNHIDHH